MNTIETFKIESGELTINVSVICYDSHDGFEDQWEGTDKHHGGVTITNPMVGRNSYKYFIPKHYTLADLAADYAKQGRENPSSAAYQSMQEQLVRDITASDYGFRATAYIGDILVLDDEHVGCGFDYSYDDEGSLLDCAVRVWDEYDTTNEVIEMAKKAAVDIVANIEKLTAFIK